MAGSILASFADAFHARGGLWFQLSSDVSGSARVEHQAQFGGFDRAMRTYSRDLYRDDPVFSVSAGEPTTLKALSERIDISEKNDGLKLYAQTLKSEAIGDIIGLYFRIEGVLGARLIQMCLLRDPEQPIFQSGDIALLHELSPILQLANASLIHREDAELLHRAVRSSADRPAGHLGCAEGTRAREDLTGRAVRLVLEGCDSFRLADHAATNVTEYDFELTKREWEIVAALHQGHSNRSIGGLLNISLRTVENHLRAIFVKTGATNRVQVVMKTTRH
jgi:DNA-binding CsgD family transcriptional regulator